MLNKITEWWTRKPARERILAVLAEAEWLPGREIRERAGISRSTIYVHLMRLEEEAAVISKPDAGAPGRRLYRLHPAGGR